MEAAAEIPDDEPELATAASGARLLVTSVGVFLGIVMLGGVIGVLLSQSESEIPVTLSAASAEIVTDTVTAEEPTPTTAVPTPTTADPQISAGDVDELLEFGTVEFLELPKAVLDRVDLQLGDSFTINIADNDKIGGELQAVQLTKLGELAPGFLLSPNGTLSGTATECGNWSAQYALKSTNPAVGTSWIEITVAGCSGT